MIARQQEKKTRQSDAQRRQSDLRGADRRASGRHATKSGRHWRREFPRQVCRELIAADEFRQLCDYERVRADRAVGVFSLISLNFPTRRSLAKNSDTLGNVVAERIRDIDEVGYLANDKVGLLAPHTSSHGARVLATDVISRFPESMPKPTIEVFEYKAEAWSDRQNGIGQRKEQPQTREPLVTVTNADIAGVLAESVPAWKRSMDVIGAIGGLIVLSPLFLLIAAAIKLTSRGPVFFAQQRTGRGGRAFAMYKFRSMVVDAEGKRDELLHLNEQDGPAFKIQHDPRITRIGHWLRRASLDELPQLLNVLKGDMSFVGPRPLPCHETAQCEPWQRRRLAVTPGITCIWQVQNRATPVPFAEWMRMDIRYAKSISLRGDLQLFWKTAGFLLGRRNR